jgi:HPt (histidine-containing phosphotransfer) domain-containing protein
MDGYEATRQLRASPQFERMPIIALTAGAFKAQQENALNAGMNAFVSKPFNVEELLSKIQTLTQNQPTLVAIGEHGGTPPVIEEFPGIDIEKGMSVWSDSRQYRKFLLKFSEDFARCGDTLATHFTNNEQVAANALLHKLKGVAGNLALLEVARIAAEIETHHAETDRREGVRLLGAALETAFMSIKKFVAQAGPAETSQPSGAPLHDQLVELLAALDRDSPDHANKIVEAMNGKSDRISIEQIQTCIDNFDFRGAEAVVHKLLNNLPRDPDQADR